ncbi:restriction endonuclease subunit S [Megasphaera sp.]|uniref:restriction endonuclease subunit S n=1 Tax=Megasphaera sp. TaxID=2023260 RepID=UPI00351FC05E
MKQRKKPALRFKGFVNDWEQRKLNDIADVRDGTHNSPQYQDKGHPFITSKNVKDGFINYAEVEYISDEDFNEINKRSKVAINDILMGMIGTIGNMALIRIEPDFAIKNVALIKDTGQINHLYLYHFLHSPYIKKQLFAVMDGGTQKFISLNNVRNLNILSPKLKEQIELGIYFENLEKFITLHQRKLEKLQNLKKAMLEKMFPKNGAKVPEIRFKGFTNDWEQRKLGDYVTIISGDAPSKFDEGNELYVKVDDLNCNSKYVIDSKNKVALHESINKAPEGSVVFPKRGAAIMTNKVRILADDCYIDTNLMALSSNKIDSEFLYNIISKEGLYKIADTSTIPQINNKHIEPYEVLLPRLDEQRTIGKFFKDVDNFITLHQRKLRKLQNLKKAMLEKMFI